MVALSGFRIWLLSLCLTGAFPPEKATDAAPCGRQDQDDRADHQGDEVNQETCG